MKRTVAAIAVAALALGGAACTDEADVGGDRSDRVEGEEPERANDPDTGAGGADGSGDGEGIGGYGGGAGADTAEDQDDM